MSISAINGAAKALRAQVSYFMECSKALLEFSELGLVDAEQHPLGFYRVDVSDFVIDCGPRERFFLHLWRPDAPIDSLGLVHTHIFSITSLVLKGCLENIAYKVERNAERTADPVGEYLVEYTKGGSVVRLGDVGVTVAAHTRHGKGRLYGVELGTPHETRVISYPTVTLIRKFFPTVLDRGPLVYSVGFVEARSSQRPLLKTNISSLLEQCGAEHD